MNENKELTFDQMLANLKARSQEDKIFFTQAESMANIMSKMLETMINKKLNYRLLALKSGIKRSRIAKIMILDGEPLFIEIVLLAGALGLTLVIGETK